MVTTVGQVLLGSVDSRLCFVDLAGSEKTSKLDVENQKDFRESCRINSSLLHLGRCLQNLKEGKNVNIARDSNLTMLLLGYMNENNNVVMLCNVRQDSESLEESIKVVQYASSSNRAILPKGRQMITSIADNYCEEVAHENNQLLPYKPDVTQQLIEEAKSQIQINQIRERMATFRQSLYKVMDEESRSSVFFNEFTGTSTFEAQYESFKDIFKTDRKPKTEQNFNESAVFASAAIYGSLSQQKTPLAYKDIHSKWQ